jgi:hypothetical protein
VPTNNNGHSSSLFTGVSRTPGALRTVLRFDLPALQGRATVTHVVLALTARDLPRTFLDTPATLFAEPIAEAWREGIGQQEALSLTVGSPCAANDVTWTTSNCIDAWTAGVPVTSAPAVSAVTTGVEGNVAQWDATSGTLVDTVQGWLDAPASNFGWRITSSTEVGPAPQIQRFYAREGAFPPTLAVDFACKPGFAELGTTCTSCTAAAQAACAASVTGNACVDLGSPTPAFACTCGAPGYSVGTDGTSCVDVDDCVRNPCDDAGDVRATCSDRAAPDTGYDCTCSPGWIVGTIAGLVTCVDVDECAAGACAHGTCTNVAGGYTCACDAGYVVTGGDAPTCTPVVTSGGCCDASGNPSAVLGVLLLRRRRRQR